jgi:hypothetical protein
MIKSIRTPWPLTELPALQADTLARRILARHGLDPDGGVVELVLAHVGHVPDLRSDPELCAFAPGFDWDSLPGFVDVWRVQDAALLLHAGFAAFRTPLQVPVALQARSIMAGDRVAPSFCSPTIAAIMSRGLASYADLDSVLSTEDVYNLAELLTAEAINDHYNRSDS